MKIKLPQIDFKRILKSSEGTDIADVHCGNCRNLHITHYVGYCVDFSNQTIRLPHIRNKNKDCLDYKRVWWKFWVR